MNSSAKPVAPDRAALLRNIPSVDELLGNPALAGTIKKAGRALVTKTIREILPAIREKLSSDTPMGKRASDAEKLTEQIVADVHAEIDRALAPSLRRVINATGVVLHTNLGRAPLSAAALDQALATATRYSNLEYDVAKGARGKRDVHTGKLLAEMAGAEAAVVVNNNAAAIFLALNALAKGGEVIVSRGELIEIGDGFRIPEIMSESGALLREVGTTNRTTIADYERAINERTRLLLRVHPSNFRITGFTARATLQELAALGRAHALPVYEDLGSGCIAPLGPSGVNEPLARESFAAGADVISFSGDKLLGGPQAGVIAGRRELIERIRRTPLFRALRVDKLIIAALAETLQAYQRGAYDEIPALRMIRTSAQEILARAKKFAERSSARLPKDARVEIREGVSVIGGGSTPDQSLPTHLVCVTSTRHSAAELEARLRAPAREIPVIARIEEDRLALDLRTVFLDEETALGEALAAALAAD